MDALGIVVRPLAALALFGGAAFLAWWLKRFIPEGRIKRVLFERHPIVPRTEAERRDWRPVLYLLIATIVQFAIIGWFTRDL